MFADEYPDIASLWHPTLNKDKKPENYTSTTSTKVWFLCPDTQEPYESRIDIQVKNGAKSPFQLNRKLLIGYNDLMTKYPSIADMWDFEKNDTLPQEYFPNSKKSVWWKDPETKISYTKEIRKQVADSGKYPFENGGAPASPGINDLRTTHPRIAKLWHPTLNNGVIPDDVTAGSSKIKYWWLCPKYNYPYQRTVRDQIKAGEVSPLMSNHIIIKGVNDVMTLNPELMEYWDYDKNDIPPDEISEKSSYVATWKSDITQKTFKRRVYDRKNNPYPPYISKEENEVVDFLKSFDLEIIQHDKQIINPYELDMYIPKKNIAIEYNGLYWHTERNTPDVYYHYNKWEQCKQKNIQLITIWSDDWKQKRSLIENMLKHKLNISNEEKVYARKTHISEIDYYTSKEFCNKYHIQGSARGTFYIGLRDQQGNLCAVTIWKIVNNDAYLERYCTSKIVVGGLGKIISYMKRFLMDKNIKRIITFSDHCVSNGTVYEKLGFVIDKYIDPDYTYLINGTRKHKFGFRIPRFKNDISLIYKEGLSEKELAKINNIERIWDCGKTRYIMNI